jgi:hypothetical protein
MALVRLLIIFLLLLIGLSTGMDMYVAGNATGIGYHNLSIDAPGANISGNNSTWVIEWRTDLWDNLSTRPSI